MIRLLTLGSLDLRAPDGSTLQPILRQPKRLALLAYLSIEKPGQFHRRDELLGLFWPESDLRGGRASLSQAIHFLRQYLGKDAIVNRGDDEIGIAPDLIGCDAATFQEQLATRRFAEAMELYRGQLLPSFFVGESEGFEQWLEQKRDFLQREAMRACTALADKAEAEGRYGEEVDWLRRAIGYSPYEEGLHRRLIGALDLAGDRAAALLAYDQLVETLRREFEAEPSAETLEVVQAVRARSEARQLNERMPSFRATSPAAPSMTAAAPPPIRRRRLRYAMLAGIAALALSAALWGAFGGRDAVHEAPVNRIAVLYFNDASPNNELEYLADGLNAAMIEHLGQVRQVQVISQNGVRPFRGQSVPVDSISRQLDAGTIVGGSIQRSGDKLRVNVEISKGSSGVVVHAKQLERPTGELFALLDDIAAEVGAFLRESLGEEIKLQRYQRETESVAAWQAVQKAEQTLENAQTALDRGDMTTADGLFDRADSLLSRAAQLDKKWDAPLVVQARAHEKKAWLSLIRGGSGPAEHLNSALAAANEALKRDRNSASAYETLGRVRLVTWMIAPPAGAESGTLLARAEHDLTRALALDPDRARAESTLSTLYDAQGRFENAREAARRALEADAYLEDADQIVVRLFQMSFELGDDEEAGHWCDVIHRRLNGKWPEAHCDLLMLGWSTSSPSDARKALYIIENFGANDPPAMRAAMQPRLAVYGAAAVARSGDKQRAEQLVRDAVAAAPNDLELLHVEAAFRASMKDYGRATELLNQYFGKRPDARPRIENGRMFQALRTSAGTRAAVDPDVKDKR